MRPATRWIVYAASAALAYAGWNLFRGGSDAPRAADPESSDRNAAEGDGGRVEITGSGGDGLQPPPDGTSRSIEKAPTPQQLAGEARRTELEQTLSRLQNSAVYIQGVDDPDAEALARRPKRISLEPAKPSRPR